MSKPWAGICRLGAIGDNLIAASVLPHLAEKYQVEVIAQAPQHCVYENNPYISKLTVMEPRHLPSADRDWHKWFSDRAKEYGKDGLFVNLSHSCESTLALFGGQSQFYWPAAWRRKWCGHSYLEMVHDIVGVPHQFSSLYFPTEAEMARAWQTKEKIGPRTIGWLLSGTRIDKVHPYAALAIARTISETGVPLIMFGAGAFNYDTSKKIMEHVEWQNGSLDGLYQAISPEIAENPERNPDPVKLPPSTRQMESAAWSTAGPGAYPGTVQLGPKPEPLWPVRRTLAQLFTCDLVIGPDSGPLWAVAMEAMPKIMLLSHASPTNITKHWNNTTTLHADPVRVPCWPCHQLHDSMDTCTPNRDNTGAACISDISVETLVTTATELLQQGE